MRLTLAVLLTMASGLVACSGGDDGNDGNDGDGGGAGSSGSGTGYCQGRTAALLAGSGVPANPSTPLSETPIQGSGCNAVEREFPLESGQHVPVCSEIDYSTNPPCTGAHYGLEGVLWADYRVYDEAIPRGFWVHSLEHGAIAFLYSCTDCDDEVAAAIEVLDDAGADPFCVSGSSPTRRTLLAPDPRLETAWAAAGWGFTLTADCFETGVFRAFLDAHRGQGPEPGACGPGIDPTAPP